MPSTFTWLDYSEHERRKMLDVIELFGERTTRDELGLGSIRDAFADLLFPGTSTIQTRAKYFLFIPWIYLALEGKRVPSATVALKARKLETELIIALKATDEVGVIGGRAKENLQRLPSSIYWQGLHAWGIRQFLGAPDAYHRSLDLCYARRLAHRAARHEFDGESQGEPVLANWHAGLPAAPDEFPDVATFQLEPSEAEYLRERILSHCAGSLLALLVRDGMDVEDIEAAWLLEADLPPNLREQLKHGRNFSEVMLGAQLLYNLLLAERSHSADWTESYRARLQDWWQTVSARRLAFESWDRQRFWQIVYHSNPRVSGRARAFVNSWIDQVLQATQLTQVADAAPARLLIEQREVRLKGGLARLRNQRALELWPGAAGDRQLDLRWNSARRIVLDIVKGREDASGA